jgi:DNA replication protein DnaC
MKRASRIAIAIGAEKYMLNQPTLERLTSMRLHGMAAFLRDWLAKAQRPDVSPLDLVGMMADAEWLYRENRALKARLTRAKLKQDACMEDIDYGHARGLAKALVQELATCQWVAAHQNVIITGKTGLGKSYLACALGNKACRDGYSVVYRRTSRLFDEIAQARAEGSYTLLVRRLAKANVLILDDFGVEPLSARDRKELLEVLEDRYGTSSTIITTQLNTDDWHPVIGDETIADAICDRVVHNAHKIDLDGESIRKKKALTKSDEKGRRK